MLSKIHKEKENTIFVSDGFLVSILYDIFLGFRPIKYVVMPKRIIISEQGIFGLQEGAVRIKCCDMPSKMHIKSHYRSSVVESIEDMVRHTQILHFSKYTLSGSGGLATDAD